MTITLEELIIDLSRDARAQDRASEREGIDRRIIELFDLSDIKGRRVYLMCFGEKVSDVTVGLAVLDMPGRDGALIGDLLALRTHAERYGRFPFPVICRGSWTTAKQRIHYPCLKADTPQSRTLIELAAGTDYWPADTRFLLVDKPV